MIFLIVCNLEDNQCIYKENSMYFNEYLYQLRLISPSCTINKKIGVCQALSSICSINFDYIVNYF